MGDKKGNIAVNIEDEMRHSYIDYAMSVIIGRAIPDIRDGLKPVHRRILFGMYDLKNYHDQAHKKSARVVGDVIGKYHPHGESAVYDALVRMAQEFSMRKTLIEGQGNFGSVDGDPAAAMRYTEVRMEKISSYLLKDIEKDTVDFEPNYDETTEEPTVMPARFPNLLLNGSSGIAVGMATNIPPHNLGELIDGILALVKDPDITVKRLMKHIPGPDFPTGGFIYGIQGIKNAYETGRGKILMRAKAMIETQPRTRRNAIVVTEIPYGVNKARLIEKIAELVKSKKMEGIADLRDESDREGMRVVIELKKDVNAKIIMNQLYKKTPMESTFGIIMLAIVTGKPVILNLKDVLTHFIYHRRDVVIRRTRYDLKKAQERAHILEGLVKALNNIDEVIEIIKSSKNQPEAKERLIARFDFSEIQAQAILDMRLGRLTSMEVEKVIKEYEEVMALIKELKRILEDERVLIEVIVSELKEIKEEFADERRTEIVAETKELTIEDLIDQEDIVVTLSHNGYIKRTPLSLYRSQKRGGKGMSGMEISEGDFIENIFIAKTHDHIVVFTDRGKAYGLRVHEIPQSGRVGKGRPVVNLVNIPRDEKIASMIAITDEEEEGNGNDFVVMVTKQGTIKKTLTSDFKNARHNGIIAISISKDDEMVAARSVSKGKQIIMATQEGYAIRFSEDEIRPTGRSAQGVKGINLSKTDEVVGIALVEKGTSLLTVTERGFGKLTKLTEYSKTRRGGKGVITMKTTEKTGKLLGVKTISKKAHVIMISNKSSFLRLKGKDISIMGRSTMGVKLINLKDTERLVGIAIFSESEGEIEDRN